MDEHCCQHPPRFDDRQRWPIQQPLRQHATAEPLRRKNDTDNSQQAIGRQWPAIGAPFSRQHRWPGFCCSRAVGTMTPDCCGSLAFTTNCVPAALTQHIALPGGMPITCVVADRGTHRVGVTLTLFNTTSSCGLSEPSVGTASSARTIASEASSNTTPKIV